jgi:hypothetical protein
MDYRDVMLNRHKVPKMDYWELAQRAHMRTKRSNVNGR